MDNVQAGVSNLYLHRLLQSTRPAFLLLTPVCVLLGASTALAGQASPDAVLVLLTLGAALCAHISVNTLNEYFDFRSGLDLTTARTAFSGGSGVLPRHPQLARAVLTLGLLCLAVTGGIGAWLVWARGIPVLGPGLAGLVLIVGYTPWLNRSPLLCLIAPGLGFGILMVVGSHLVLGGGHTPLAWLVSLVPFFLVNNLLLLNQYPDRDADAGAGRRHAPIAWGIRASNRVYALFMVAAYSTVPLLIGAGQLAPVSLIALLPVAFSLFALAGAVRYGARIGDHPRYLAANVAATLLTPLLVALSILYG